MSRCRRPNRAAITIAALAVGLSPAVEAWGASSDEVKELQAEVSQLRSELAALQATVGEALELERQRSANLVKALKEQPGSSQPAPPPAPPVAAREAREPTLPPTSSVVGDEKPRSASRHHRTRRSKSSRSKSNRVKTHDKAR